ncbi:MAG: RNA 2',3'-cyclic phosphodiesterase [Bacteroidota bacterium]
MPGIRSFIAIDTSPEIKDRITEVKEKLRATAADVRWESREKFHITLKFLGNVEDTKLESIAGRLEEALTAFSPFDITYEAIGCFPNQHHPRVIWVGALNTDGSLRRIQETFEEIAVSFGFQPEERKFHPHITIGRVKGSKNLKALVSELATLTFSTQSSVIEEVLLMKSDLKPTGSVYTVLRRFPLKRR